MINPASAEVSKSIPEELSRLRKSRNGENLFFDKRYGSREALGEAIGFIGIEFND
jgi:hypothetical protein